MTGNNLPQDDVRRQIDFDSHCWNGNRDETTDHTSQHIYHSNNSDDHHSSELGWFIISWSWHIGFVNAIVTQRHQLRLHRRWLDRWSKCGRQDGRDLVGSLYAAEFDGFAGDSPRQRHSFVFFQARMGEVCVLLASGLTY